MACSVCVASCDDRFSSFSSASFSWVESPSPFRRRSRPNSFNRRFLRAGIATSTVSSETSFAPFTISRRGFRAPTTVSAGYCGNCSLPWALTFAPSTYRSEPPNVTTEVVARTASTAEPRGGRYLLEALDARSISRDASRFLIDSRLSKSFFPFATPISTFARPFLK